MTIIKKTPQGITVLKKDKKLQKEESPLFNYTYSHIAIFAGSWSDLNILDFSTLNLRFVKFDSKEFTEYLTTVEYFKGVLVRDIIEEFKINPYDIDRLQVLIPIDISQPVSQETIWLIRNILLIIFPSDITIIRIFSLQLIDKKFHTSTTRAYNFNTTGQEIYDNYLTLYDHEIESINQFIPIYLQRYDKISYLKSTINSYLSSFFQNFTDMEYLSLCIALESIVDGKTELIYRIRRNTSILLSDSPELCKIIYNNIKEIYDVRSSLVHAGEIDYEKVKIYLPYLRKVISRLIIELISINIPNLVTLNNEISYIGFGDRAKLADPYINYSLSSSVRSTAVAQNILEKYKETKQKNN